MRILVTGAAGMLGTTLVPVLRKNAHLVYPTDIDTSDEGIKYLDVRDSKHVRDFARGVRPELIAHLAAKTDVEKGEIEPEDAYATNATGTGNVASVCNELSATMVFISTAGVFDGTKEEAYVEEDEPNPVNVYGRTKLEGEKIVRHSLNSYFIVRAGWMMGSGISKDKKFVAKVIKQIDAGRKEISAVTDRIGTPTYTTDFSRCLEGLIRTDNFGTYHMVCKGRGTRCDVAAEILRILGRDDITLNPVTSDFFEKDYFAPRPRSEMLENARLKSLGMDNMRHWKIALEEYLEDSFRDRATRGLGAEPQARAS